MPVRKPAALSLSLLLSPLLLILPGAGSPPAHAQIASGASVSCGPVDAVGACVTPGAAAPLGETVTPLIDPLLGICDAEKTTQVDFCASGLGNCSACPDGTYEYLYRIRNRGSLPMTSVRIPVPSSINVIAAGFFDTPDGTAAPDSTNVLPTELVWLFATNPVDPPPAGPNLQGEITETLFICSDLGPPCPCYDDAALSQPPLSGTCRALGPWSGGYTRYLGWPFFSGEAWRNGCRYTSPYAPDVIRSPIAPAEYRICREALLDAADGAGVACFVW